MTTSVKNNFMPAALISNLQQVLITRNDALEEQSNSKSKDSSNGQEANVEKNSDKPVILVTNGEGIGSPGLTLLVESLVRDRRFNVHVCAPQSSVQLQTCLQFANWNYRFWTYHGNVVMLMIFVFVGINRHLVILWLWERLLLWVQLKWMALLLLKFLVITSVVYFKPLQRQNDFLFCKFWEMCLNLIDDVFY